jgi:transcriptional regulator with XRE-family HTH domain
MKGKSPTRLNKLREAVLSDSKSRAEYETQRLVSELGGMFDRLLKDQNLSQVALARKARMQQPDLNALLRGRAAHLPTLPTLTRLVRGLGVPLKIDISPNGDIRFHTDQGQHAMAVAGHLFHQEPDALK